MIEYQIKAIAKDYAQVNGGNIVFPIRIIAEEVLRWLTNDYCIVEKEKVSNIRKQIEKEYYSFRATDRRAAAPKLDLFDEILAPRYSTKTQNDMTIGYAILIILGAMIISCFTNDDNGEFYSLISFLLFVLCLIISSFFLLTIIIAHWNTPLI